MRKVLISGGVVLMALAPVFWIAALWVHAFVGISGEMGNAAGLTGVLLLIIGVFAFTAGIDQPKRESEGRKTA